MFKRFRILPLDADDSSKFLPWTVAFMTYLAGLALAGALALTAVTARFEAGQASTITVEITPPLTANDAGGGTGGKKAKGTAAKADGEKEGGVRQSRLNTALELLRTTPGVIAAEALERAEVASLLKPWLGEAADDPDLPLPDVIDVAVDANAEIDTGGLADRLAAAVPGASLHDHGTWFAQLATFVHSVQWVAGFVLALTCLAAVMTVVYVTRTGLAVHQDIIEMLHLIGAEDRFIARQFQAHALRLALSGAVPGLLAAVLTVELLRVATARIDSLLLPDIHLSPGQWVAMALVPLAAGLIAMLTARATVLRQLGQMI